MSLSICSYNVVVFERLDDHDVLKFLTYSLGSVTSTDEARTSDEERQRLDKEFQEYQEKLQKQKEEYAG